MDAISYEDLYELLRAEKYAPELQAFTKTDLQRIKEYIKSKEKLLSQQSEDMTILTSQKRAKIQMEIDNAMRVMRDLHEVREQKVINNALFSIRGGSGLRDTTNMMPSEIELYNQLLELLTKSRKAFFSLVEDEPITQTTESIESTSKEIMDKELTESAVTETKEAIESKEQKESKENASQSEDNILNLAEAQPEQKQERIVHKINIQFKEDTPELIGEDLKTYGPFKMGDCVELPEKLCEILIAQGKAKKIELREREESVKLTKPTAQSALESTEQPAKKESQEALTLESLGEQKESNEKDKIVDTSKEDIKIDEKRNLHEQKDLNSES